MFLVFNIVLHRKTTSVSTKLFTSELSFTISVNLNKLLLVKIPNALILYRISVFLLQIQNEAYELVLFFQIIVLRLLALNGENRIEFGNRDIVRHLTSLSDSQSYGTNEISTTIHILSSKVPVIDATQEILSLAEAYRSNITELEEKVRTYFEGASIDEFLLQYPTESDIGDDQSGM